MNIASRNHTLSLPRQVDHLEGKVRSIILNSWGLFPKELGSVEVYSTG